MSDPQVHVSSNYRAWSCLDSTFLLFFSIFIWLICLRPTSLSPNSIIQIMSLAGSFALCLVSLSRVQVCKFANPDCHDLPTFYKLNICPIRSTILEQRTFNTVVVVSQNMMRTPNDVCHISVRVMLKMITGFPCLLYNLQDSTKKAAVPAFRHAHPLTLLDPSQILHPVMSQNKLL